MPVSREEIILEKQRLKKTIEIIKDAISALGMELYDQEEKVLEFKKFLWDSHAQMDPTEMKTMMSDNDVEVAIMMNKGEYLQKLFRIQNKPYFGSIIFKDEEGVKNIYIGITHVEKNLNYYVHDWRSPICSLFYDYETGEAQYEAPSGIIQGEIMRKRQYTIEDGQLIHVFDNEVNIDDELLQEVLAGESSDKMKNIVNTIQKEQNKVIRNIRDKNLIVQGIAGSGKTSVALHRIAFLLYKIADLSYHNILIFSPNQVFSEYISNVLPELGEENTKETTYHEFLLSYLKEFKEVESFTAFIERYYKNKFVNYDLICYKQSDEIIDDINLYLQEVIANCCFEDSIISKDITISQEQLNGMLRRRYSHFPLFKRIEMIAEKICDWFYEGRYTKKKSIMKMLFLRLNLKKDYIDIYNQFFLSSFSRIRVGEEKQITTKRRINYEDATLFIYMKNQLEEIDYNTDIQQIVIDEAQDYTKTQYLVLMQIFRRANYTILGDVNQTINPYYKYDSLQVIGDLLPSVRYLELLKTYRSSEEIILYTNRILHLEHVSAIRRSNAKKVLERNQVTDIKASLIRDIENLKKTNKSIAVITKTDDEAERLYQILSSDLHIVKLDQQSKQFERQLIIIPSYVAKGLEFDAVIVYTDEDNAYTKDERYLFYVACTRAQHQLIVYHQT